MLRLVARLGNGLGSRVASGLACAVALATAVPAQGGAPTPGYRLYGPMTGTDTWLVDENANLVHTWPGAWFPGLAVYMLDDGSLLRSIRTRGIPGITGGHGGGVQRVAFDGTVLWDFRYDFPGVLSHHDIEPMPNGNVLLIAWEDKTAAEAIAAGRDPQLILGFEFRPDHIVEVQPTGPTSGAIVWEWHVWDHLIQDHDPSQANYGVVANHPELVDINYPPNAAEANDWNHSNAVDYDPERDLVVISAHRQSEIWIIDHSTTTAEAAGHTGGAHGKGGDLLYRWGNPEAYRAGTAANQQLFHQHASNFIPRGYPGEGNLTVFNNRHPLGTAVWELVLPIDPTTGRFVFGPGGTYGPAGPIWSYAAPGFSSRFISGAERLPSGNTLICSGAQGTVFEVTPAGQVVWSHSALATIFHAHHYDRTLWSDRATLSVTTPDSVVFDLVAGSAHAGQAYLVLGSATGTSPGLGVNGLTLPLNADAYLRTTAAFANIYPFGQTLGTLNGAGGGRASFSLPGGLAPLAGLHLDHAYAVIDPATARVVKVSNAVPLDLR